MSIKNLPESSLSGLTPQTSNAAVITSSTGSPTITTDGTATVYKFTGDGTLVVGTAGVADLLLVSGGGGSWTGQWGGGGGDVVEKTVTLPAGTLTVAIGAGGSASADSRATTGGESSVGTFTTGRSRIVGWSEAGTAVNRAIAWPSSITGSAVTYAAGDGSSSSLLGDGAAGVAGTPTSGVVIVRVG